VFDKRKKRAKIKANLKKQENPKVLCYIAPWDEGLAPNPFGEYCTLALCKPIIRRVAEPHDWIVGLSEKDDGYRILYVMIVMAVLSFEEYWNDSYFQDKKPDLTSSNPVLRVGDNIYQMVEGEYKQHPSMHTNPDGSKNNGHYNRDLGPNYNNAQVLIGNNFCYFGRSRKEPPSGLNNLARGRGHRVHKDSSTLSRLRKWFEQQTPGRSDFPRIGNWDISPLKTNHTHKHD
jgi:hypothetical protein